MQSPNLLVPFDSGKLACDSSPVGVGVIFSHRLWDGSEKLISYAIRTLSPAERKSFLNLIRRLKPLYLWSNTSYVSSEPYNSWSNVSNLKGQLLNL